jgi:hypothetical protein
MPNTCRYCESELVDTDDYCDAACAQDDMEAARDAYEADGYDRKGDR